MDTPPPITVTKLDAARRQLRTAIELWANDGDPVSVHSLAFAAHQIIHDLNRCNKGPQMLLDSPFIRPEKKNEYIKIVKRDANFFKHADSRAKGKTRPETEIEFAPESNELFIDITITGLQYLGQSLTEIELAFWAWFRIQRPDLLTDAGRELLEKTVPAETAAAFRAMSKQEFLQRAINLIIRSSKTQAAAKSETTCRS